MQTYNSQKNRQKLRQGLIEINKKQMVLSSSRKFLISKREKCYFVVWSNGEIKVELINRDKIFWKTEMEPKLTALFMKTLLREYIHSRKSQNMELRFAKKKNAIPANC